MKMISLMRHGDAPYNIRDDFNRILSNLGKEEVEKAAFYLNANYKIDIVISSDAPRAKETANIIIRALNNKNIIHNLDHEIYKGLRSEILTEAISNNIYASHILIIGHNPSILECVSEILDKDSDDYNRVIGQSMRTSQIITLSIDNKMEGRYSFKLADIFDPSLSNLKI